jgi:glutathione S-transferase
LLSIAGKRGNYLTPRRKSMSLTFYAAPMSTASVTEAVIAELGIDCDRINLDLRAGDTRKPEYLKINPNGKVPAIVHDGTAIWESSAITMYLGELFGVEAKLYPAPGPQRGEVMKWIAWSNVTLAEAAGRLFASLPPEKQGDPATNVAEKATSEQTSAAESIPKVIAMARAKADLVDCLKILDAGLEGRSFLIGEYSLADTHLQSIIGWIGMLDVDLTPFANVTGWLQRCYQRPAIAKLMAG